MVCMSLDNSFDSAAIPEPDSYGEASSVRASTIAN